MTAWAIWISAWRWASSWRASSFRRVSSFCWAARRRASSQRASSWRSASSFFRRAASGDFLSGGAAAFSCGGSSLWAISFLRGAVSSVGSAGSAAWGLVFMAWAERVGLDAVLPLDGRTEETDRRDRARDEEWDGLGGEGVS